MVYVFSGLRAAFTICQVTILQLNLKGMERSKRNGCLREAKNKEWRGMGDKRRSLIILKLKTYNLIASLFLIFMLYVIRNYLIPCYSEVRIALLYIFRRVSELPFYNYYFQSELMQN